MHELNCSTYHDKSIIRLQQELIIVNCQIKVNCLAMPNQYCHAVMKLILGWFVGGIFGQTLMIPIYSTTVLYDATVLYMITYAYV